jgi:hypothetical protein
MGMAMKLCYWSAIIWEKKAIINPRPYPGYLLGDRRFGNKMDSEHTFKLFIKFFDPSNGYETAGQGRAKEGCSKNPSDRSNGCKIKVLE